MLRRSYIISGCMPRSVASSFATAAPQDKRVRTLVPVLSYCLASASKSHALDAVRGLSAGGVGRSPYPWGPNSQLLLGQYREEGSNGKSRIFRANALATDVARELPGGKAEDTAIPLESIILDVGGMKCGGCSAAVKRMLITTPYVDTAAVNLLTETAVLRVRGSASALGPETATMLTNKGFPSNVRLETDATQSGVAQDEADRKRQAAASASMTNLGVAWCLALFSVAHHAGHLLHALGYHEYAHNYVMVALGNPWFSGMLGAFALLGPGRSLLADGFKSLAAGNPNMNSLVGIGCTASFSVGVVSALMPGMGFDASFLEEPVMLLAFVLLGRALEARAKVDAAADLKTLAGLIPATTRLVLDPGVAPGAAAAASNAPPVEYLQVPTSAVRVGDVLRILPGERVPVDGEVIEGRSSTDESMLTGESRLVAKQPGSAVTGGTINYEGPITVRAAATGSQSTLAGIARLVSDAQAREAPVQRLADAVAGKFCYGVMTASVATLAFWAIFGVHMFPSVVEDIMFADPMTSWASMTASMGGGSGGFFPEGPSSEAAAGLLLSIKLAVDVLVVACPCALGLATPTAVLVASSLGARRGLLLRGGDVLERLAGVTTVVMDKTGTLTEGKLRVSSVSLLEGACTSESEVLALAAAAESSTRHPLADAILAEAQARGLQLPFVAESSTVVGSGVIATVDGGKRVAVGKEEWVLEQVGPSSSSIPGPPSSSASIWLEGGRTAGSDEHTAAGGSTIVYVGVEGRGMLGRLSMHDTLRSDAVATVDRLKEMGIRVHILSGDQQETVNMVAARTGVELVFAEGGMSPEQKLRRIDELRAGGAIVAMVGDGVNDAPALAAADVGIALKGGLEAAGEAASVVLMGDRLHQVLDSLELGRATLSKIKQNLVWALLYNLVGVPLAAGALLPTMGICLNPSAAAGMMAFSSVAVVSNSLLLRARFGLEDVNKRSPPSLSS